MMLDQPPRTPDSPLHGVILVIDDSAIVGEVVARFFSRLGWTVDVATSGLVALDKIARARPDVVICDLHMPDMDGVEVLRRVRAMEASLPVVILSQDHEIATVLDVVRGGAFDYVVKSGLDVSQLASAVDRAVSHTRVLRENARLTGELHRSNEELERRVAERTAMLESTLADLRTAQEQLVQREKMATMGLVAAGVAHELNNPAAFVIANLEHAEELLRGNAGLLAHASGDDAAQILAALTEMNRDNLAGMKRIRGIVRSLRTFAAIQPEDVEDIVLSDVVHIAANVIRAEIRYRGRLRLELAALQRVAGDRLMLTQVVTNLLANAAQAITQGGVADNEIAVTTSDGDGCVILTVTDTGCGIEDEIRSRILEPFFTTKRQEGGSGLGLSICADIVRKHGGSIAVESAPGRGSRFDVVLPVGGSLPRRPAPSLEQAQKALRHSPRTRVRVLIVDDEAMLLRSLRRMLRHLDIVTCHGGREALQRLEHDRDFDAILCDVMMPDVDGAQLYAQVAERHPALAPKMLFYSGGAFTQEARAFVANIGSRVLDKPIDTQALLAAIDAVAFPCAGGSSGGAKSPT